MPSFLSNVASLFAGLSTIVVSFASVAFVLKNSLVERHILPYINVFGELATIPFLMMAFLYFFAYIVNTVYVMFARMLSVDDKDVLYAQMKALRDEFIMRLPGFLMAYVCATIGKVAIELRASLAVLYTLAALVQLFSTMIGFSLAADYASAVGHAVCFNLFFLSISPNYSIVNAFLNDTLGGVAKEFMRKLKR